MTNTTYHVALAIGRTEEGDLVVEEWRRQAQRLPSGGRVSSPAGRSEPLHSPAAAILTSANMATL
jgi:hypothetical protein